jgi:hypothetical protein
MALRPRGTNKIRPARPFLELGLEMETQLPRERPGRHEVGPAEG